MKKIFALLGIFCLLVVSLGCGGAPESETDEATEGIEEAAEGSQSIMEQAEETAEDAVEAGQEMADETGTE